MKNSLPKKEIMYEALMNRDPDYEGIFVVAVKTTGVFCRPTCTAKKPKEENVEFFKTPKKALHYGYRPCKICKQMSHKGEVPGWLKPLIEEVNETPGIRLKDWEIRDRGLDPNRVRRWFKENHGMTFQEFLRVLRIGHAFGRIRFGKKVVDAAFESGYESLSGFTESFKNKTGFSPLKSHNNELIKITRILTPLGPMLVGALDEGICLLEFIDRKMLQTQLKKINSYFGTVCVPGDHKHFKQLDRELKEYFNGKRKIFTVPIVYPGSDFQVKVWEQLRTIPYGTTRSYGEQAKILGRPKAVRAVASANGANRIAVIVPCHRVIGKDGKLVGYGGGLWRKKYLLELEMRFL